MTMSNEMKPRLRLSPYKDDWEKFVLKDKASFSTGHGYSKNDLRTVGKPIILYGRLYTNYETIIRDVDTFVIEQPNSILSKGGEIIIPSSGETAEDISVASMIAKAGIIIGGGLNIIKTNEIEPAFLALLLTFGKPHKDLTKSAQGKTIVHLYNQDISQVDIVIPKTKEEQRTLAYFIDKMDSMIIRTEKELSKLQEVKKAYRSMLFPRLGEKKPRLRFKGFTDDWDTAPLSDYLTIRTDICGNDYTINNVLSVSGDYGVVNQIAFQGRSFAGASIANYRVVNIGNVIYTKSPLKANPYGIIKAAKKEEGVVSPLYAVYNTTDKGNANFIQVFFDEEVSLNNYLRPLVNKGAKNTLLISDSTAISGMVTFPKIEEQRAIADFFVSLDTLIQTNSRRLEQLKRIKSACLDGMFVNE